MKKKQTQQKQPLKVLSVAEMLEADDIEYVQVPAWGGVVRLATIDAETGSRWADTQEKDPKNAGLIILVASMVDAEGTRIGTIEHVAAFQRKGVATLNRLVTKALTLNGVGPGAVAAAKNDSGEASGAASPSV